MNREMTTEEYETCYRVLQQCVPHARVQYVPTSKDNNRQVVAHMLPLLMMRHRRIPRSKWRDQTTPTGKHWIEQDSDNSMHNKSARNMIGYHLAYDSNLIGMVMTQGKKQEVVNIGLGMKQLCVYPPEVSVPAYAESFFHKLTDLEMTFIDPEKGDEVVLRRLCLLLALKQSFIKAIGQPPGYDWARLQFDIENETVTGDREPLVGWEFRVWQGHLGFTRDGVLIEEHYQCACAFFRGNTPTKFVWQKEHKDLESWVQFINLDQLINVVPKLTD